jgi:hypothetical protein
MRRLVGEGFNNRFVTGERLEAMLKVRGSSIGNRFHFAHLCSEGNTQSNYIWCDGIHGWCLNPVRP